MTVKDFLDTNDFSKEELLEIIGLAQTLKRCTKAGYFPPLLAHKHLGMIFQQVSTRTRISFEAAMADLGGTAQFYAPGTIQLGGHESIEDSARVMGRLLDVVVARVNSHKDLLELAQYSSVPVINAMSNYNHPTQELGDMLTIIEHKPANKSLEACKLVFVGDATQVCVSIMFICSKMGMTFVQYGPQSHHVPENLLDIARENCKVSGGSVAVSDNRNAAVKDADFVYTDVWYGLYDKELSRSARMAIFYPTYQVTPELMSLAAPNAKFMHCLPATRGEEVVDEVVDGPASICWDEAENRKHSIRGILAYFCQQAKVDTPRVRAAQEELDSFLVHLSKQPVNCDL